jgi:hypothetical protein
MAWFSSVPGLASSLFGFGLFFFGFRMLRSGRLLADIPRMPIRSVALGMVTIEGKVQAYQMVPGPVSSRPCCFYKVRIEEWDKKNQRWDFLADDWGGPRFFLSDDTGKVLIDAYGADLDFEPPQSLVRKVSSERPVDVKDENDPKDSELMLYIASRPMTDSGELAGTTPFVPAVGYYRLSEFLVLPGQQYQVTGTCKENPDSKSEDDRIVICADQDEPTFVISAHNRLMEPADERTGLGWAMILIGAIYASFCIWAGLSEMR